MSSLALPDVLIKRLNQALAQTDDVAFYNVTYDNDNQFILDPTGRPIKGRFARGGPFGALLGISLEDGSFEVVGQARGNNVVGSGIASYHAEDQALQPDNYRLLKSRLSELKASGKNPFVWMVSSAQSCTNCHTKQEIMARDLEEKELIKPGHFVTHYGATFDDTFKIAQFYDAQYADAMIFSSIYPKHEANLIRQEQVTYQALPREIQKIFETATSPTAVVMRKGEIYAQGSESRSEFDLYSTAEVNAVRAACRRNRSEGVFTSWTVDGELYTTSSEIGPLLFAEVGWTKIGIVKSVTMPPHLAHKQFETRETSRLTNTQFLHTIAGGYENNHAAIRVVRDECFNNKAQPKWAEMLSVNGEQLYNGAAVLPIIESMRNQYTRYRFSANDICTCSRDTPVRRPARLLESIAASVKYAA